MSKDNVFPIRRPRDQDFEPITLVWHIYAGISAIGTLVAVGQGAWQARQRREMTRRQAEKHMFEASRQLKRLMAYLDDFSSYADEYDFVHKSLGIGQAPIVEDVATTTRLRRLRRDVSLTGDRFAIALEELTALLGDSERVDKVQSLVLELTKDFDAIPRVEKYGDCLRLMISLADKVKNVLHNVASLYGIRFPE